MTTTYVSMRWVFNHAQFARDIRSALEAQGTDLGGAVSYLSDMTGVKEGSIRFLLRGTQQGFLTNTVLAICNALDLDPRAYFEVIRASEVIE